MVVREAHDGSDGSRYRAWDAMKPERDATVRFLSAATTQQQPRPLQHGVDDEEAEALASFVSFFGPQLLHARSSASSVHVRPRRSRRAGLIEKVPGADPVVAFAILHEGPDSDGKRTADYARQLQRTGFLPLDLEQLAKLTEALVETIRRTGDDPTIGLCWAVSAAARGE